VYRSLLPAKAMAAKQEVERGKGISGVHGNSLLAAR